jgi:ATP-dependent RNA helicase RhlE
MVSEEDIFHPYQYMSLRLDFPAEPATIRRNDCLLSSSRESPSSYSDGILIDKRKSVVAHLTGLFSAISRGPFLVLVRKRPGKRSFAIAAGHGAITKERCLVLFAELNLSAPLLEAIRTEGYTVATPIQAQAIPHVLAGRDVLGCAQTGTGKTAAFALPILHRLSATPTPVSGTKRSPRCLVLCPTRELASQIAESFAVYGKSLHLRQTTVFGGVGQHRQVDALRRGVDILVATPGRLMDLMQQRLVDLSAVQTLVLDEADRMLDMGFIQPIRQIVAKLPAASGRQTLLFSATMAPDIRRLADSLLRNPAVVNIAPPAASIARKISESVYRVERHDKPALLAHLVHALPMHRTLVFTRTKHGADRVVRHLHTRGIRAEAIHGNKSQNARERALANFIDNKVAVLVATDIASRGIDVDGITHVVNYDLTHEPETYVHRIGRTGRAGASGEAVSFCDREEVDNLKAIERLLRRPIPPMANPLPATNRTAEDRDEHSSQRRFDSSRPRGQHGSAAPRVHSSAASPRFRSAQPKAVAAAHPKSSAPRPAHPLHRKHGQSPKPRAFHHSSRP